MRPSLESVVSSDHGEDEESQISLNSTRPSSPMTPGERLNFDSSLCPPHTSGSRSTLREIYARIPAPSIDWRKVFSIKTLFGWDPSAAHRSAATSWLDGLRGVAAVQVFFFHFFGRHTQWGHSWGSTPEDKYIHQLVIFRPIWAAGSGAVSTFFVISGYAITYKCLNLIRQRDYEEIFKSLSSSFFRRGFRLFLPLLLLAIPTLLLIRLIDMSDGFLYPTERKDTFYLQFKHFVNSTDEHFNPFAYKDNTAKNENDHNNRYAYVPTSWTIPMEYYGSLVCYLMVLAISRVDVFLTRCFILSSMALYSAHRGSWWSSNFLIGMLIADWMIERKDNKGTNNLNEKSHGGRLGRRIIHDGSFFILFLFGTYLSGAPPKVISYDFNPVPRVGYEWLYKITPPFMMFRFLEPVRWWWYWVGNLTVLGISQVSWLRAIFDTKFCQWLGKLSFALYLVHALVISILSAPLNSLFVSLRVENKAVLCLLQFVVQTPCIVMLSTVVERYVDRPSINFARWIEGKAFTPKRSVELELGARSEARDGDGQEMVALIPPV